VSVEDQGDDDNDDNSYDDTGRGNSSTRALSQSCVIDVRLSLQNSCLIILQRQM
jgi:hypothetical protein